MYSKELYQKYKESRKRSSRRYYLKNKGRFKEWHRKWFQKNYHEIKEQNKIRNKLWIASHKEWNNEYQRMENNWLAPERIPETDDYDTFCVDLNLKIEKEGFINGSKC